MAGGVRNLEVDIDGNPSGFDRACDEAGRAARTFDRELERLERAQRQQERSAQASTRATQQFSRATSDSAIASRKAGLAAQQAGERSQKAQDAAARAAERASVAQQNAADAAQALERGEITAAEAAQAQARAETALARSAEAAANAERQLERANIAAAVAARAAAKAANEQADEERQAAEAAVQAAAMERLAHLRASGSVREHNDLLRRMRREYSGFGHDTHEMSTIASRAFGLIRRAGTAAVDGIGSGLEAAATNWPMLLTVVAVALAGLPIAAIAAGGAITLALGGALAGVGILAVAKSAEVKAAFGSLAGEAKKDAQAWAAPFKPALVGIANSAHSVLAQLGPTMTAIFAQMAPAVQRFADNLGKGLISLSASFPGISAGFTQLLDAIGPNLPQLFSDIGMGLESIAKAAGDHAAEFGQLILVIGRFVNGLGTMIGWLINAGSAVQRFFGILDALGGQGGQFSAHLSSMETAAGSTGAAIGLLGGSVKESYTAMQLATLGADELKTALDSLAGKTLSAREAAANYATAVLAMNKSLHDNGSAHGYATAKGIANERNLTNLAKLANENKVAMDAEGKSTRDIAKFMDEARAKFVAAAEKMHYSSAAANALADKLFGVGKAARAIPARTETQVKGDIHDLENKVSAAKARLKTVPPSQQSAIKATIAQLEKQVAAAKRALAGIHDKAVTIRMNQLWSSSGAYIGGRGGGAGRAKGGYIGDGYAVGGMVGRYADAGLVSGPGSGTSDDVPIMASNGEYMMRASSVPQNRAALDAANWHGAQLVAVTKSAWHKATYSPWGNASIKPAASRPHAPAEVASVRYPAWWHGQASTAFGPGQANFAWGSTRPEMAAVAAAAKLAAPKSPWGNATYSPWGNASVAPRTALLKSDGSRHSDYLVSQLRQAIQAGGGDPAQFLAPRG